MKGTKTLKTKQQQKWKLKRKNPTKLPIKLNYVEKVEGKGNLERTSWEHFEQNSSIGPHGIILMSCREDLVTKKGSACAMGERWTFRGYDPCQPHNSDFQNYVLFGL